MTASLYLKVRLILYVDFKDEVKEVKTSFECGISLEGYRDIKEGDVIEAYLMEEIAPQL